MKWATANAWVTENSGLKIQSKSDAQIKTEQSRQNDSRTLVVTITKNATSKPGIYEITLWEAARFVKLCPARYGIPSGVQAFVLNR